MEAASKKRSRGRPATYDPDYMRFMSQGAALPQATLRGRTNYLLFIDAQGVLGITKDAPTEHRAKYRAILDWEAWERRERGACKQGVLTQIGRAYREFGNDIARLMADRVCQAIEDGRLVSAREAELTVRAWRRKLHGNGDS
jgi:hypothetical protein